MPILPSDTTANSRCRSTSRLLTKSSNHLNPPRPDGYNGFFVMTLVIVGQKMLSKDTPNNQKKNPSLAQQFSGKEKKRKKASKRGDPRKVFSQSDLQVEGGKSYPKTGRSVFEAQNQASRSPETASTTKTAPNLPIYPSAPPLPPPNKKKASDGSFHSKIFSPQTRVLSLY